MSSGGISPYKTKGKINLNNLIYDDTFIDLINNLSKEMKIFYQSSKNFTSEVLDTISLLDFTTNKLIQQINNNQIENIYINGLNNSLKQIKSLNENLQSQVIKNDDNTKHFFECAKIIFKEMKIKRNNKLEDIYDNIISRKSDNSMDKFSRLSQISNNSFTLEYSNFSNFENMILELSDFNKIIGEYSIKAQQKFIYLQKKILLNIKNLKFKKLNRVPSESFKTFNKDNPFKKAENNTSKVLKDENNDEIYKEEIQKYKELVSDKENVIKELEFENKKKTKELSDQIEDLKIESQKKIKKLNDENTSISKYLVDKNREVQTLQNNYKMKKSELEKLKIVLKNNEEQLRKKIESTNKNSEKILSILKIEHFNLEIPKIEKLQKIIKELEKKLVQLTEEKNKLELSINSCNEELNSKNSEIEEMKIENYRKITEIKNDKEKIYLKLKEYKTNELLTLSQMRILKEQIKDMQRQKKETEISTSKKYNKKEFKQIMNDLQIENKNFKMQLNIELGYNGQLQNELRKKNEQIDGLNIFINKLMSEKEKNEIQSLHLNNFCKNNLEKGTRSKTCKVKAQENGEIGRGKNYKKSNITKSLLLVNKKELLQEDKNYNSMLMDKKNNDSSQRDKANSERRNSAADFEIANGGKRKSFGKKVYENVKNNFSNMNNGNNNLVNK